MGSIDAACIAGFLCRLCSEMHRTVIHIYSDQGEKHGLPGKINAYLPVTITPYDPLPKTICKDCMKRVEQHHELMIKIGKHRSVFISSQSPRIELVRLEDTSVVSSHSAENRSQEQPSDNGTPIVTDSIEVNGSSNSEHDCIIRNDGRNPSEIELINRATSNANS